MEETPEVMALLERIASALERIANSLEREESSPSLSAEPPETLAPIRSETLPPPNDFNELQAFLASRNITIKHVPPEQESDETLNKIAVFMGKKYTSVKNLLSSVKSNMVSGRPFTLNLRNEPQQTIADTTNLCTNLYNIAFLTAYHYQPSPVFQLFATPSTSPKAQNFYSGQWLERFVKTQVISLLSSKNLKFSYLCNPQISLSNGDDFELDMLFEAEGEIFWLEAKTGDYRRHIEKYSKMSKIMRIDSSHTFMIVGDEAVTDGIARDLSSLFGMTVVRIEKFAEELAKNLPAPAVCLPVVVEEPCPPIPVG